MTNRYGTPNKDVFYGDSDLNDLNDIIYGNGGNDVLFGLRGNDRTEAGDGQDVAVGNEGNDVLLGEAGNDLMGQVSGVGLTVDPAFGSYLLEPGDDLLDGGAGDDVISGGDGSDQLLGGVGTDILGSYVYRYVPADPASAYSLTGLDAGEDQLNGGEGNDYLSGGLGNDRLLGGLGSDVLGAYALSYRRAVDASVTIAITGFEEGNDLLDGGEGDDYLSGGVGNDVMLGGAGNDVLGEFAAENIIASPRSTIAATELGNDRLEGGLGSDRLNGGTGNDVLIGASLASSKSSRNGSVGTIDELVGGTGRDLFVLGIKSAVFYADLNISRSGTGDYALIKDFRPEEGDRIQLNGRNHYSLKRAGATTQICWTQGQRKPEVVAIVEGKMTSLSGCVYV